MAFIPDWAAKMDELQIEIDRQKRQYIERQEKHKSEKKRYTTSEKYKRTTGSKKTLKSTQKYKLDNIKSKSRIKYEVRKISNALIGKKGQKYISLRYFKLK